MSLSDMSGLNEWPTRSATYRRKSRPTAGWRVFSARFYSWPRLLFFDLSHCSLCEPLHWQIPKLCAGVEWFIQRVSASPLEMRIIRPRRSALAKGQIGGIRALTYTTCRIGDLLEHKLACPKNIWLYCTVPGMWVMIMGRLSYWPWIGCSRRFSLKSIRNGDVCLFIGMFA